MIKPSTSTQSWLYKASLLTVKLVLIYLSLYLPVLGFWWVFHQQFDPADVAFGVYWGDGLIISALFSSVWALLSVGLSRWFIRFNWLQVLSLILTSYYYLDSCTQVAWAYRALSGATWLWSEVSSELVLTQRAFYGLSFIGLITYYVVMRWVGNHYRKPRGG